MEIKLWDGDIPYVDLLADTPNLMRTFFLDTKEPLPCVVVLPGGAYRGRARHEADPIAEFFNAQGFHAVVVEYRVAPNRFPAALADAQRAVKLLRYHAKEWRVDPERIVVCGFSAGGHLAASSILYADVCDAEERDEVDSMPHLPNGAILCYPVISVDSGFGHVGSGINLFGEQVYEETKGDLCLAKYVTDKTPPVFLWHTSDDAGVNVKNSLVFAEALRDHGIPFELHVFPHGPHGLGLAPNHPDVRQWAPLAADWIRRALK